MSKIDIDISKPDPSKGILYAFSPERWAWLDLIAYCEGTDKVIESRADKSYHLYSLNNYKTRERIADTETGYDVTFGFREVQDLSKHPKLKIPFGTTYSTAFGRYQIMDFTEIWLQDYLKSRKLPPFPNYQPPYQDQRCLLLIDKKRHALTYVDKGIDELDEALGILSHEWASLPPGRYGQPSLSVKQCHDVYLKCLSKWK